MKNFLVVFLLICYYAPVSAGSTPVIWADSVGTVADSAVKQRGFNGAIAVTSPLGQRIIYRGMAEQKSQRPLAAHHLFSSGSVGKQFTTVAILQLVQRQKLQLTDSISKYLREFPASFADITVQDILSHTSGLPKIKWHQGITTAEVKSQLFSVEQPVFQAGTSYLYSNLNVMLRALLIEVVCETPFIDYIQQQLFKPSGMQYTVQIIDLVKQSFSIVDNDYPTAVLGVSFYTTATDLLRWQQALLDGRLLDGKKYTDFLQRHTLSNKDNHADLDFGRYREAHGQVTVISHDGSNVTHHVVTYSDLQQQLIFVAISNDGDKSTLHWLREQVLSVIDVSL